MPVDKSDAETERKKPDNKKPRASEQAVTEQNGTTDYIGTDPMWEFVYAYECLTPTDTFLRANSGLYAQSVVCRTAEGTTRSVLHVYPRNLFRKNAFFALHSKRSGFEARSRQSREVVAELRQAGSQMLRDAMLAFSLHNCEMIAANQPVVAQNSPLSSVILWVRHSYLNLLKHIGAKYDKGFCRRYKQLTDYVFQKKIKLPDCNILNEYHVYEIAPK